MYRSLTFSFPLHTDLLMYSWHGHRVSEYTCLVGAEFPFFSPAVYLLDLDVSSPHVPWHCLIECDCVTYPVVQCKHTRLYYELRVVQCLLSTTAEYGCPVASRFVAVSRLFCSGRDGVLRPAVPDLHDLCR